MFSSHSDIALQHRNQYLSPAEKRAHVCVWRQSVKKISCESRNRFYWNPRSVTTGRKHNSDTQKQHNWLRLWFKIEFFFASRPAWSWALTEVHFRSEQQIVFNHRNGPRACLLPVLEELSRSHRCSAAMLKLTKSLNNRFALSAAATRVLLVY